VSKKKLPSAATAGSARLPVVPSHPPKVRASRTSKWRAGVLVGVHLIAALHVAHWLATGSTLTPVEPSEGMELGRNGVLNVGAIFFLAAISATAIFGRFFCGWGCHVVALQDLCRWLLEKVGIRPRPLGSRWLALIPFVAFYYMFLWPLTYRLIAGLGLPRLSEHYTTERFWATFPGPGVAIATLAVCGFACVYLLGAKGFCTYGCPYGAIFGVATRVAPLAIRVTDACQGCAHCTAVCTSNVRVHEEVRTYGMVVDSGCMKCLDCVSVCPNDALYLGWGRPSLFARARAAVVPRARLKGRDEAVLVLAFLAAYAGIRGLYGLFPFLFALGIGVCLAYLAWLAVRLWREPNVALRRRALKHGGVVQPAGWIFLAGFALTAAGWAHCAAVQSQRAAGFAWAGGIPAASDQAPLDPQLAPRARRAAAALERAARWGLLPQPDLAAPLARLGAGLATAGDLDAAERALAVAARPERASPQTLADLGLVRARRGDLDGAIAALGRAVESDPSFLPARENLAGVLAMAGRFDEAVRHFAAALETNPEDHETRLLLARALAAAGRPAEARIELGRILIARPEHEVARALAAELALPVESPTPSGLSLSGPPGSPR
jgi:polyferredoxin/tetratricopeptide (TPR) repeat protein